MFALFIMTSITLFFGGSEYEACKADGITDVKVCAERTWEARTPLFLF